MGMNQEAFADRCGFARTYMSRIETGGANPSINAIKVLADALGVSISVLLRGCNAGWSREQLLQKSDQKLNNIYCLAGINLCPHTPQPSPKALFPGH